MTFTISVGVTVVIAIWALLFLAVTTLVVKSGLLDDDRYGIGILFSFIFYLVLWLLPSLVATLVWSLWFR